MSSFADVIRLSGLHPRDIVPDGKIRRCSTESHPHSRNGWYVLNPDGTGAWGDWSTGSGSPLGHWRDESASIDQASLAKYRALAARQRAEAAKREAAAISAARGLFASARPYSAHKYIVDKGLSPMGCKTLRVWDGSVSYVSGHDDKGNPVISTVTDRWLLVPMCREGSLTSVQRISGSGLKLNTPGCPTSGVHWVIERARPVITVLCEGPATGLAILQSCPLARVIVCFVAGNLLPVAEALRPTGPVVVAADNDHGTMERRGFNPGIDQAKRAAELLGCGIAWPEDTDGTDFADMLKERGPPGAKMIERIIHSSARYVVRTPTTNRGSNNEPRR